VQGYRFARLSSANAHLAHDDKLDWPDAKEDALRLAPAERAKEVHREPLPKEEVVPGHLDQALILGRGS
jgi:hypothetical protein